MMAEIERGVTMRVEHGRVVSVGFTPAKVGEVLWRAKAVLRWTGEPYELLEEVS